MNYLLILLSPNEGDFGISILINSLKKHDFEINLNSETIYT